MENNSDRMTVARTDERTQAENVWLEKLENTDRRRALTVQMLDDAKVVTPIEYRPAVGSPRYFGRKAKHPGRPKKAI